MRKQVVGFQHVHKTIEERMHVLPLAHKFVVEGTGLGEVMPVRPGVQPILFLLLYQAQP
jgi:hypothetical protein